MTAVTLADACLRLPELIGLVAKGEHVVIMQNGVVLAGLTPPPFQIPTPEEEATRRRAAQDAVDGLREEIRRWHEEEGLPYPSPEVPAQPEMPAA